MNSLEKNGAYVVAHISLLILFPFIVAGIILTNFTYTTYFEYKKLTPELKKSIFGDELDQFFFQESVGFHRRLGFIVLSSGVLSAFFLISPCIFWARNVIQLIGSNLQVRAFRQNIDIPIHSIRSLRVITTTPSIPLRISLDQVNWRDQIEITYQSLHKTLFTHTISLFGFPKFKMIIMKILSMRPDLILTFSKKTFSENLKETIPIALNQLGRESFKLFRK